MNEQDRRFHPDPDPALEALLNEALGPKAFKTDGLARRIAERTAPELRRQPILARLGMLGPALAAAAALGLALLGLWTADPAPETTAPPQGASLAEYEPLPADSAYDSWLDDELALAVLEVDAIDMCPFWIEGDDPFAEAVLASEIDMVAPDFYLAYQDY